MVIFRKTCFGTRSPHGSHSHSVLPSLLLTAKRQGKHPLEFFEALFTSDTATAQAVLYNDLSWFYHLEASNILMSKSEKGTKLLHIAHKPLDRRSTCWGCASNLGASRWIQGYEKVFLWQLLPASLFLRKQPSQTGILTLGFTNWDQAEPHGCVV